MNPSCCSTGSCLSETVRKRMRRGNADYVGVFVVRHRRAEQCARRDLAAHRRRCSRTRCAETLTETEKAFQLGFVSMSEAILVAIKAVSLVIVVIIMAVMANTMTMTARERLAEYATLKALGFSPGFVVKLLFGESLVIALIGGGLGHCC